jgi:hypothetical protein
MNNTFQEDIAPVVDRTAAGIDALKRRNLMTILTTEFTNKWIIHPGECPPHQNLPPLDKSLNIDPISVEGDGVPTNGEGEVQQAVQ